MKRIVIIIILLILLLPISPKALALDRQEEAQVIIYLVYPDHNHNKEVEDWLNNFISTYGSVSFEINNSSLVYKQIKKIKKFNKDYYIVIGSNIFSKLNNKTKEEIKNSVNAYLEKDHCNLVNTIENNKDINECLNINKNIYPLKDSLFLGIILMVIPLVLIGLVLLLWKLKKTKGV